MKTKHLFNIFAALALMALTATCGRLSDSADDASSVVLFEQGCYPYVVHHEGHLYYTMQVNTADTIALWEAESLEQLARGQKRTLWTSQSDSMQHFWSPELHRLNGHWYLYFEGDDGNTDNHHIYVMECQGDNPMKDDFVMKGAIMTNPEWNYGIHPSVIELPTGQIYLFWSGWPKRRAETETQCIYIAHMANPWTIDSERVMLSSPSMEWERQWINPDGNRSAYPIYVNENPEPFLSPDGKRLFVAYSASGVWTVYQSLGLLSVPLSANLLDANAWTKSSEPLFRSDSVGEPSTGNVCLVNAPDGTTRVVYEAKWRRNAESREVRQIRMQPISWTPDGTPLFGQPATAAH